MSRWKPYVQPNERTMDALRKACPEDFVDRSGPGWKVEARDAPFSWWNGMPSAPGPTGFALGAESYFRN